MPRVIVTAGAARGLEHCRRFLAEKNQRAAQRAAAAIKQALARLEDYPESGRPHAEEPNLRELMIEFGDSGYIALYQYGAAEDAVDVYTSRRRLTAPTATFGAFI